MKVRIKLHDLVGKSSEHRKAYAAGCRKKAQVRQDLINPFFKLLGRDVYNEQG